MPHRNAASVLPEPVGARISVLSPAAMAGQPWAWASVGAGKLDSNHARTGAENRSNGMLEPPYDRGVTLRPAVQSPRARVRVSRVASRVRGVLRGHLRAPRGRR